MADQSGQSSDKISVVLLQRVLVLAVGLNTEVVTTTDAKQSSRSRADKMLTLSLNLQEAQLLALALEKGRLSVAVRHVDDQSVQGDIPAMNANALFDSKSRSEIQRSGRLAEPEKPIKIEAAAR
jgi:pilus assembly protein CpaB